jgi:hypothetical protein
MSDEEIVDALAKVIWDTYKFEPKSTWNASGWSRPFDTTKERMREIARELLVVVRQIGPRA